MRGRSNSMWLAGAVLLAAIAWDSALAQAQTADAQAEVLIERGARDCRQGEWLRAVEWLRQAHEQAGTLPQRARAAATWGLALHRMGQHDKAEKLLREAYDKAGSASEQARYANDLGNLALSQRQPVQARGWYEAAQRLSPLDLSLQVSVSLNLARMEPASERLEPLRRIAGELDAVVDERDRARYAAQLGVQATGLGAAGSMLAHASLQRARQLAIANSDTRLQAQSVAGLAALYEAGARPAEALVLVDEAARLAQRIDARDILFRLEGKRGKLLKAAGRPALALSAYRRAVEHIEAIRQDIPVSYESGESSFRVDLAPIYLGLADLLLAQSGAESGEQALQSMREAREVVEQIKRSELEDYLGERCTVASARTLQAAALPAGTAVLYPILLPDRLELLVETARGLHRKHMPIRSDDLQAAARAFTLRLRDGLFYRTQAQALYDNLLRPIEGFLAEQRVDTLVVVPDGALRQVPFGALMDGERFAIEKFAVVTAPALSVTASASTPSRSLRRLVAGVSIPDPGSDKMNALARPLPGVRSEVLALSSATEGPPLLDTAFTVSEFEKRLATGDYGIVHIASHGVFEHSNAASWIMAYDGRLTLERLQDLLRIQATRERPLELLALSACETAEGDDRAPLGLSGAALKARARSAMGSLWRVSDKVTPLLMTTFYEHLGEPRMTKAKALQAAQLSFISRSDLQHPYNWAAFVLVGSWQ